MTLSPSIRFQDYQFNQATPAGAWRWTTRMDTSSSAPAFSVRDIRSPYGLLRDSIPLPGDIVQAMAQSISDLKSAFAPTILLGPPSTLTFTVDEGRGFAVEQAMLVTNSGPYGSLLDVTATVGDAFVAVTPADVGGLATGMASQFNVSVNATDLLAIASPYASTVTIQDPDATNTPQLISVTINVRPKAEVSASPSVLQFYASQPISGNFPPLPYQYMVVQNLGPAGSLLNYQVQKLTGCSPWLASFTPVSGQLASSAVENVQVVVQPTAGMQAGTYVETLRVSGYSTNSYQDVLVQLIII